MPAFGIYARHVRGIQFEDVRVHSLTPDARPATVFVDAENVTPADFASQSANSK